MNNDLWKIPKVGKKRHVTTHSNSTSTVKVIDTIQTFAQLRLMRNALDRSQGRNLGRQMIVTTNDRHGTRTPLGNQGLL
jgi:hypothetical protein